MACKESNLSKRVLITGQNGYVGSILAPTFAQSGHDVAGLDSGYYEPCTLVPDLATIPWVRKDLRDLEPADLQGFDAVQYIWQH